MMVATALLIIDMQRGNFQGSNPIYEGGRLLARIQNLIAEARGAGVFYDEASVHACLLILTKSMEKHV